MHIPQGLSDSLISGYLGCFHVLVIVNNAAVNKDVEISLPVCAFYSSAYILRSRIAGSHGSNIFISCDGDVHILRNGEVILAYPWFRLHCVN